MVSKSDIDEKSPLKVQKMNDGVGPMFHRIYEVLIKLPLEKTQPTMAHFKADINYFSPQLIASFKKTKGLVSVMKDGDEYDVKLGLPLDAPVRVKGCVKNRFVLVTLTNHIEAGEIEFSLTNVIGGSLFKIESLARSRDSIIDFFYDKVPLARAAQGMMWSLMCNQFANDCAKHLPADSEARHFEVEVKTFRQDEDSGEWIKI